MAYPHIAARTLKRVPVLELARHCNCAVDTNVIAYRPSCVRIGLVIHNVTCITRWIDDVLTAINNRSPLYHLQRVCTPSRANDRFFPTVSVNGQSRLWSELLNHPINVWEPSNVLKAWFDTHCPLGYRATPGILSRSLLYRLTLSKPSSAFHMRAWNRQWLHYSEQF